jgi:hypothetical protein
MSTTPSTPTVSSDPLWGRAYKVSVRTSIGQNIVLSQSGWEPEALRINFEVQESVLPSPFWFATVTVYNVDKSDLQNLLWNAEWLTLEAGYQTGSNKSSIIWDGPVLQVMYDRPHVVDTTIIFNCVVGPYMLTAGFVNYAAGNDTTQYQAVQTMMGKVGGDAGTQTSDYAATTLRGKTFPRGKTFWGSTSKYIAEMSDSNFISHFIKQNKDYMTELYNPAVSLTPQIIYGPPYPPGYVTSGSGPSNAGNITRSIVGTPRQSQWGVSFEVLLDPRLHVGVPPMLIQIEQGALIAQLKLRGPGGPGNLQTPLDKSGLYVVGQVTHHGDSRGNEWYTSVQAYTRLYAQGLLTGTFNAQQKGVTGPGG